LAMTASAGAVFLTIWMGLRCWQGAKCDALETLAENKMAVFQMDESAARQIAS